MNEQQLADMFSEQLDLLLQEQPVALPAEAVELQELLGMGQQFAQAKFEPSAAAQAAFQGQLATWFTAGSGIPSAATWLGIPKNLVAIMLIAGGGLGLAAIIGLFALLANTEGPAAEPETPAHNAPAIEEPTTQPEVLPQASPEEDEAGDDAGDDANQKSQQSSDQLPGAEPDNSTSDTINAPKPASTGDSLTLPTQAVISSTATITPTGTPGNVTTGGAAPDGSAPDDDSANTDSDGNAPDAIDDDRGHGNDPGGFDPDNPGNSTGVGGGQDNNPPNLGRGNESTGSSGSSPGGGNSGGNSSENSSNNGKGKGNNK